ncbi:Transport YidE/YbjL family protein [Corynebacterium kutscheri]|uniref:Putative permease n=1 Tax=Corynebacterium kutscheri TaxID=35755 RepID=A0A0F6TCD1_9CORY|nr:TrkA C-terminal domain-containing protein [Corynebacterium kutscheri]AKE40581.1 putative permease [Corynebacterium kutscheri]VEH04918.1 Transport YidE/YbjL family protein [Corynebacterium kutscheri]VEH10976.1 Transport YidE/YbjL family protein [Corynebacterium kutscheri]VEH80546.1 Transport YidE/YbjL family protein [Corynebacterium kutscheri]
MLAVYEFFALHPIVLICLLIGVGMAIGKIRIHGIGLGAAAVLFLSIAVSALAAGHGFDVSLHHEIGHFGLALFAFTIGITAGPSFFHGLRTAVGPIAATTLLFIVIAIVAYVLGVHIFGMDIALVAGIFAGALTNTPALAAAGAASGNEGLATIGYSVAYLLGVIVMITASYFALGYSKRDKDAPSPLANQTIFVERTDSPKLSDIYHFAQRKITFTRIKRGDDPMEYPDIDDVLHKGDLLTIVGPRKELARVALVLGRDSKESLIQDRSTLDFRRITVSDPKIAGQSIDQLNMAGRFHATISRVRRGDIDMIADPHLVLQEGDRVRVVAPTKKMPEITKFFGDSASGLSDINPVVLGLGMAVGLFIGGVSFKVGDSSIQLGAAAGTLIVGLILGKIGRIGPVITTISHTAAMVLSEFGLLVFLAQAGSVAGSQVSEAFASGEWIHILLLGAILTTLMAVSIYATMRWLFNMGGTRLSGFLAGVQTQPAVLAFANARTNFDPRIALGYSLIYPVAMIVKILVAQVLGGL